ncbi:MAG: family 20 glycosylhydrolase [Tahibacter sp.]
MKRLDPLAYVVLTGLLALLSACALAPAAPQVEELKPPALIPAPRTLQRHAGQLRIDAATPVLTATADPDETRAANYLIDLLKRSRGLSLPRTAGAGKTFAIRFTIDAQAPVAGTEAYSLDVDAHGVSARARNAAGLFYAAVTLAQLMTPDAQQGPVDIGYLHIEDAPRFAWRGVMLDVARHLLSIAEIERIVDAMAQQKLNVLHWHLTDDQGWRIEIKKYPKLTAVGAWRVPAGPAAAADIDPATGQPRRYGGYYSQEQIRQLVAYAAARQVTIVPEIDMPGHAQAAIAAYPELGTGDTPRVSPDWGVHTYLLNVDESTLHFMENVLDEVVELFPGRYIHVGGDEAAKDRWHASAAVQKRMRDLGVKDEAALQAWFMRRLDAHLTLRGRKLIGWDEILEGELPPAATVMSWRGTKGAIEAARLGHDVVLAPHPDLYLDNLQSNHADEPSGRPHLVTLADVYAFNPVPAELDAQQATHVLGAQANAWSEHMRTPERVEHALFPRIAALAEVDWSPPTARDWNSFLQRLPAQFARWKKMGIAAADSAFAVEIDLQAAQDIGTARVTLTNQASAGSIRYTLDGSEPHVESLEFREPLLLHMPQTLRANTFVERYPMAQARARSIDRRNLLRRSADELSACRDGGLPLRLEDDAPLLGERAIYLVDIFDACWRWPRVDLADVGAIGIEVGNIPYNFQLWHDADKVVVRPTVSPDGELQIGLDDCNGPPLLRLPLTVARANTGVTGLRGNLPPTTGVHDLCFRFGRPSAETLWAIQAVQLLTRTQVAAP